MMQRCLVSLFWLTIATATSGAAAQQYDVILAGGRVLDGTGNPWRRADVAIADGLIRAVGDLSGAASQRVIDVTGLMVVPGFIDLHSHADGPAYGETGLGAEDTRRRTAPNLVMQGITTVVVNQDGRSVWPIAAQRDRLASRGIGLNAALLVGHGTVRRRVMGTDFRRAASEAEVDDMRRLVRQAMNEGAYGMSSGLEYVPGRWSTTAEVESLVRELASYDGVYITHERSSGIDPMWFYPSMESERPTSFLEAVSETIHIAEQTGVTAVQSHIKARGAGYWGSSHGAIQLIERARRRGVPIYADQYPYNTTGSDGNTVLVPEFWVRGGASRSARLGELLATPERARALRRDIAHEISRRGAAENILIMDYPDSSLVGRTVAEASARLGVSPVDLAIKMVMEGYPDRAGGARLRGFSLSEYDVESYARMPWVATATDGWVSLPEDGPTHVRVYGSYPRKIAHYAIDRGVLSVADAVRSSTSLPAQILGLEDRGLIRPGMLADIAVLDLSTLKDNATFFEPHQFPSGVEYVMVNGQLVVDDGTVTGRLPGHVISPPRK